MRDRTLADRRPHAPGDGLQAQCGARPWRRPRSFCQGVSRPPRQRLRELFLNAAASSGVADFGFFGRGAWIDQPIAFSASQPRCGATDVRPSSPAIQSATLRLDHSPPSGGGSRSRARGFARSSGFMLPMRHCGDASRQEPRVPRHYNGRAIVRPIARQRPSSPTLARWCDHAPKARSPGNAAMR